MSLFQCQNCGCVENTALAAQGFAWISRCFDWSEMPEREGMMLCSACGPTKYAGGKPTDFGEWHGEFPRTYLPKGKFITDERGNLQHLETGDTDYRKYALPEEERPPE